MPKITKHIPVRRGLDTIWFAPGDDLPDWAVGIVGDHALAQPVAEVLEAADEGFTGGTPDEPVSDEVDEPEAEQSTDDEPVAEVLEATAPDFTKPARRTTARKQ